MQELDDLNANTDLESVQVKNSPNIPKASPPSRGGAAKSHQPVHNILFRTVSSEEVCIGSRLRTIVADEVAGGKWAIEQERNARTWRDDNVFLSR